MKATELIARLLEIIKTRGDLEIKISYNLDRENYTVEKVQVTETQVDNCRTGYFVIALGN